jgi:negative regulator of flagellin synthesis FlgM
MSMTIDRIGAIDPIQPGKKPGQAGQVRVTQGADSISISSEAQEMAELFRVQKLASEAADIRAERVAELKQKINDPAYINDTIINATANKLIDTLFG